MELFVILMFLRVTGGQLEGPENTLSVVGSTVTLKCSSPSKNCTGIDWQKFVSGASPVTIFKGPRTFLNTNVTDRVRYSVNNSSGCDLVIRNVNLTDAGRFICSAIMNSSQITKTAHLFVLETQPNCTINASMNDTVEGERVQLNCMVTYSETNGASITWERGTDSPASVKNGIERSCTITASDDQTTNEREASTNSQSTTVAYNGTNKASAYVSQTVTVKPVVTPMPLKTICQSYIIDAPAPEVPPFTCIASFSSESTDNGVPILGLATNIPNASCGTPVVKVIYQVKNVTLSPSSSRYSPGSVINCAAKGHPPPTFKWQEKENDSTWIDIQNQNGSEFTLSNVSSKRYRCVAMNVVRDKSYNATSERFQINNMHVESDSTLTGLIYLLIMAAAAGVLLLVILLIICFCTKSCPGYKFCNSGKKSKDELRDEQPLTENPDVCIYSVVNKGQDIHPKNKSPKRPKASIADAYQHEEVTYADLAMEYGPRKVVPHNGQAAQEESLYAAVSAA